MIKAQVLQSILAIEVEKDRQGPFLIIQRATTDHSQLLQRKPAKLVCSNEDIARHFPNSLQVQARQLKRRDEAHWNAAAIKTSILLNINNCFA